MASDGSDSSEEFFDAEDQTPNSSRTSRKRSPKIATTALEAPFKFEPVLPPITVVSGESADTKKTTESVLDDDEVKTRLPRSLEVQRPSSEPVPMTLPPPSLGATVKEDSFEFVEPKPSGRQRFKELRQCLQHDDEDNIGNTLTPDSQNSSVEGVFPSQKSSHPFRVIENDAMSIHSMTSLGRVGRILSGSCDPSALSVGRDSNQLSQSSSTSQIPTFLAGASGNSSAGNSSATTTTTSASSVISSSSTSKGSGGSSGGGNIDASTEELRSKSTTPRFDLEEYQAPAANVPLQEPDVIASTKLAHSKTADNILSKPVPPPRLKRKPTRDRIDLGKPVSSSQENLSTSSAPEPQLHRSGSANNKLKLFVPAPSLAPPEPEATAFPSPNTLESITRELESSFATMSPPIDPLKSTMSRISASLGNSTNSVNTASTAVRPSPSNSTKSNSAPARVSSIDPSEGLDIFKATYGKYVVKPQDGDFNKAEGPTQAEMERIRTELYDHNPAVRAQFTSTGSNSLGNGPRYTSETIKSSKPNSDRRKSAGDEEILKQLNISLRTRTDSGKPLTDIEILSQVPVKNLDTGENFPLSDMDNNLPQYINPLSLHIMRLTSHIPESDEESVGVPPGSEAGGAGDEEEGETGEEGEGNTLRRKTAKIKKFFQSTAKKTVDKAKSIASEMSHARHKEDVGEIVDLVNHEQNIKIKASSTNKGPYEFTKLQHVQDLSGEHQGAVWCMKFSSCGRLLATAGQDRVLRIWVLKDAYPFFQDMRTKYNADSRSSPTPSQESLVSHHSADDAAAMAAAAENCTGPFMPRSFCTYTGHTSDLLDISWSKNYFVLSSSMDKTVRLWHISRKECLCCFQHIDFVTAIAFHPKDDRYFLSGSLDGKLRLWNIPDKKVALWNELDGTAKLITAANFCQNGKFAVVGSYDGRCLFYNTDQLKYHTQIHVRSTRGKNATGKKISGIEPMPGEDKILVTSNDSRVRLYDLRDLYLSCKYKGYVNVSSQIKASFSHDGKFIVAGSENQCIYIWKTHHDQAKLSSTRRDRSDYWEGIKAHNATVTCAIFAPHPEAIIKPELEDELSPDYANAVPDPLVEQRKKGCGGYVLVSADFNGSIKIFINKTKPKHSSLPYTAIAD